MGNSGGIRSVRRGLGQVPDLGLAGFQRFEQSDRIVYLRSELADQAAAIVASISSLGASQGTGNRSSGIAFKLPDGTELFARIGRRGGLVGRIVKDLYLGIRARPLKELAVAAEAWRRGVRIAEPVGAILEWVLPIVYRSTLLTRPLPGLTLWEFLCTDDDPQVRVHVVEQARQAIEVMHRGGLFHADLNLHNLYVTKEHESFAVAILDFDKARLFNAPLPRPMRARNLARLGRSAHKLDPNGRYLDSHLLRLLIAD